MSDSPWVHDTYLLRRRVFKLFGAGFHIYGPDGAVAFYSELKAFKFKEDIRLFDGEDKQNEELTIKARQVIDFSAAYDVADPVTGEKLGALRRRGFKSMFRDEWLILDNDDQEIGRIKEDSMLMATLRRFINLIPQTFHAEIGGQRVATFKQHFNPFIQKIDLDFSADQQNLLDRRVGIAAAILLCAIEGRQKS